MCNLIVFSSLSSYYLVYLGDFNPAMCVHACSVASFVSDSLWLYGLWSAMLLCPRNFPGKNTRVGCHAFLQGIFRTQGSSLCLLSLWPCKQILYPLNHLGSPIPNIVNGKNRWSNACIHVVSPRQCTFWTFFLIFKTEVELIDNVLFISGA